MAAINSLSSISTPDVPRTLKPQSMALAPTLMAAGLSGNQSSNTELKETFSEFVGQTFFGQMIKAMRTTVGKAAYFDGGRGEEVFQGQLDQMLAEHMTEASAKQFAEPMFRQQFPNLSNKSTAAEALAPLNQLPRR